MKLQNKKSGRGLMERPLMLQAGMAVMMIAAGFAVCMAGAPFEHPIEGMKEKTVVVEETEPETEAVEETEAPEEIYFADRFNLVKMFPENADETDPMQSYGGIAYRKLFDMDNAWAQTAFGAGFATPQEAAKKFGKSAMGRYNATDEEQDPDDPSTWTIRKWTKISVDVRDGDGKQLKNVSNVKQILAMASVYSWYHDMTDAETFGQYAEELWKASHKNSASMSDVYYDDGCLDSEKVAKTQEKRGNTNYRMEGDDVLSVEESTSETGTEPESASHGGPSGPGSGASPAQLSAAQMTDSAGSHAGESSAASGHSAAEKAGNAASAESGSQQSETAAGASSSAQSEAAESSAYAEDSGEDAEDAIPDGASTDASVFPNCPGHVDLYEKAVIHTMDGKKNLFTIDPIGNAEESKNDRWQGWNEQTMAEARALAEADWYADYGLSVNLLTKAALLDSEDLQKELSMLAPDLSEDRRKLAETALGSIGRIPYYFGGKPTQASYEGNAFGTRVEPDYKGRVLRGLDCSGWVTWVYWNALGVQLSEKSTSGMIHLGQAIRRSELRTGDLIIRSGDESTVGHVEMFLRWGEGGQAVCVHCTGGVTNNVCLTVNKDYGASCRRLLGD